MFQVHGLESLFTISDIPKIIRSSEKTSIVIEKCNLNLRKNDYSCRVSKIWNSLPMFCSKSKTLVAFKNNVKSVDVKVFVKGRR